MNQVFDESSVFEPEFRQNFASTYGLNVTQRFGYDVIGCISIEVPVSLDSEFW